MLGKYKAMAQGAGAKIRAGFGFLRRDPEVERMHNDLVKATLELESMADLLSENMKELSARGKKEAKYIQSLLESENVFKGIKAVQNRGKLTTDQAAEMVTAMEESAAHLKEIRDVVKVDVPTMASQLEESISNPKIAEVLKQDLIKQFKDFTVENKVQSDGIKALQELTESDLKDSDKVVKILRDISTEELAPVRTTLKSMGKSLGTLDEAKLEGMFAQKTSVGQSMKESFLENPEAMAKGQEVRKGLASHALVASGLGVLDQYFDLSTKIAEATSAKGMKKLAARMFGKRDKTDAAFEKANVTKPIVDELKKVEAHLPDPQTAEAADAARLAAIKESAPEPEKLPELKSTDRLKDKKETGMGAFMMGALMPLLAAAIPVILTILGGAAAGAAIGTAINWGLKKIGIDGASIYDWAHQVENEKAKKQDDILAQVQAANKRGDKAEAKRLLSQLNPAIPQSSKVTNGTPSMADAQAEKERNESAEEKEERRVKDNQMKALQHAQPAIPVGEGRKQVDKSQRIDDFGLSMINSGLY